VVLLAIAVCLLSWCTSCQTQQHLVLDPVGPPSASGSAPGSLDFIGTGLLRVYSATETRHGGKFDKYYPHTGYTIYDTNGARVRFVRNSVANIDEIPASVPLPAGLYHIRAQDDNYGRVTVPLVILNGQTTTVYLETRGIRRIDEPDPSKAVRLPDGRIAGWRAPPLPH
jgi:hypothetical protein